MPDHHPSFTPQSHVYLAGPDVFYPDAVARGEQKKQQLAEAGLIGHYPFDNEFTLQQGETAQQLSRRIAAANEQMMRDCCREGQIGIILANMTPWHGKTSMDVGTAFEVGFMSALAEKNNVIIIGYYEHEADYQQRFCERVQEHVYQHQCYTDEQGMLRGADDHHAIEAFGNHDNLMLDGAIERSGGRVCRNFAEAVALAKDLSAARQAELSGSRWLSRLSGGPESPRGSGF